MAGVNKDAIIVEMGVHLRYGTWWYYEYCDCLTCQRRRKKDKTMPRQKFDLRGEWYEQAKNRCADLVVLLVVGAISFLMGRLFAMWLLR